MTTRITIWGTAGRIFADRQEMPGLPARHGDDPRGLRAGWNVRYTTELTEPVWFYLRGEEYSAQIDAFVDAGRAPGEPDGHERLRRARPRPTATIAMMVADAAARPAPATTAPSARPRRPRGRGAGGDAVAAAPRSADDGERYAMDRLLFGDNQFFGVNHMSEEKARAQRCASRTSTPSSTSSTPPTTRASAPSCARPTTASREVCDHVRANPERYADFTFYPCMPYAHKYANAVTENGMLGARQALPARRGPVRRRAPRRPLAGDQGHRGHDDAARSTPR